MSSFPGGEQGKQDVRDFAHKFHDNPKSTVRNFLEPRRSAPARVHFEPIREKPDGEGAK